MGLIDRLVSRRVDAAVQKSLSLTPEQAAQLIKTGAIGGTKVVTDAYGQIPTVYACVKTKALNISRVPLRLYKGDRVITSGPAYDLVRKPNPNMGIGGLLYFIAAGINLRGDAYQIKDQLRGGLPVALWPVTGAKPIGDRLGRISHYEIESNGKTIKYQPEEVVQTKYFSPTSLIHGFSPLSVLAVKLELQYNADQYNANFFREDATPATYFKTNFPLEGPQAKEFEHKLIERRKGSRKSMVLGPGMEVFQLGLSQKDADFINLYKLTRGEICSVFGVPESEIDIFTDTKYSNAETASLGFWEKTLKPEADLIARALSEQVFNAVDMEVSFDYDQISAIKDRGFSEKIDQAVKLLGVGLPFPAVNERLDLGFDPDTEIERPAPVQPAPTKSYEPEFSPVKVALESRWKQLIKTVDDNEAKMARRIKDYFHNVERKIKKILGGSKGYGKKDVDEVRIIAAFSDDELRRACEDLLAETITAGAIAIAGANINAVAAAKILEDKLILVVTTNETSRSVTIERLRDVLRESLNAGDGAQVTADKLIDGLKDSMSINRNRAETIARTEIGGAFNQAGYAASIDNGAIGTRWLANIDLLTRDSHVEYNGTVKMIGELFGGNIAYPHDPSAPAGEVVNCRCMHEPIYPGDMI